MKINFIIPFTDMTGGIRVIAEQCVRLIEMGHDVKIFYPKYNYKGRRISECLRQVKKKIFRKLNIDDLSSYGLKCIVEVLEITDQYIPDADVVIATAWNTAYWVDALSPSKGAKYYYIQGYECWGKDASNKKQVDRTWKLDLRKIVISNWLKDLAERQFNEKIYGMIYNGINLENFYNENKIFHKPLKVGMIFSTQDLKGTKDGVAALELLLKNYPDIEIIMYGRPRFPKLPFKIRYYSNPSQQSLRKIYSMMDIFLLPSLQEGFSLPPMEAMACKCAVVATKCGGVVEYCTDGETAWLSEPGDPISLAANMEKLIQDEMLLQKISNNGYENIKDYTWDNAAMELERIIKQK